MTLDQLEQVSTHLDRVAKAHKRARWAIREQNTEALEVQLALLEEASRTAFHIVNEEAYTEWAAQQDRRAEEAGSYG